MADILICDDERNLRELLGMALEGHQCHLAATGREALAVLEECACDLVITDLRLPDLSGLDVLRRAKELAPERPVVLITAFASTETAVTAMKEGAFDYLEKPFRMEDLRLVVSRALEQGALKRENEQLREALRDRSVEEQVIARSLPMRRILEMVRRVARTGATVLITGESGTGKERIARAIHQYSPRANKPFVAINCAAIPETLIESELFGHGKGAFSGAIANRKGVFEEAEGGTLLLDEIGEMPLNTQVKLLRVLQERTVRPVGGSGERPVDVRLVATTNRDLTQEVATGRFREDLYYRINVVNIHLPPLRDRREDIPLLVAHFIDQCAKRYHMEPKPLEPQALECLQQYDFPGNVRELNNLVEGALSISLGAHLELSAFPARIRQRGCHHPPKPPVETPLVATPPPLEPVWGGIEPAGAALESELLKAPMPDDGMDLEQTLAEVEANFLRQALARSGGNKSRAAELLGLTLRSMRYRLSKLGLGGD